MNYKVKIVIDGRSYNLSTDVDDGYIERVAAYVDQEIASVTKIMHASAVDAATMTSMNIADSFFREHMAAEKLRRELDSLKEKNAAAEARQEEVEVLKAQIAALSAEKSALAAQLADSGDLRAQLKRSQDECLRLRKEIVRMGKNG